MAKDRKAFSAQDSQKEKPVDEEQQPVASRTRRLSGNLIVSNTIALPGKSLGEIDCNDRAQSTSNLLCEPRKPHRHPTRRDYNELVNGYEQVNNLKIKLVAKAYEKDESERSVEEFQIIRDHPHLLPSAIVHLKRKREKLILKQRLLEMEESDEVLREKADCMADLIRQSKNIVIYTGAGISTSASIPDYRGPNGLWTQIRRTGSFSMTKVFKDLAKAEPTYTHMAIGELCRQKIVKHVVSQNFDGLHLRSGVKQTQLSEIHGNMFIEICPNCERQYFRQADVTQKTVRFRHKTGRICHTCPEPNNTLMDTIVLYGERSRSKWPMNWERASRAAKKADLIICMGTSLKTLRRYGCLWPKSITTSATSNKPADSSLSTADHLSESHKTKLVIVNLQHTSKDKNSVLKINGKCDFVMQHVMRQLQIKVPAYEMDADPLRELAVRFTEEERAKLERDLIFVSCDNLSITTKQTHENKRQRLVEKAAFGKRSEIPSVKLESNELEVKLSEESGSSDGLLVIGETDYNLIGVQNSLKKEEDDARKDRGTATLPLQLSIPDDRCSPSLFVSELTPDPDRRRLRMRIRAITPSEV